MFPQSNGGLDMGDILFRFNFGRYEFGMYRHFKSWYFTNGFITEFCGWFYIYKAMEE